MKICKKCLKEFSKKSCEHCNKESSARWRKANPEKMREYRATWRNKNPEKSKAATDNYYKNNSDKVIARTGAWKRTNRDKVYAHVSKWRKNNKDKVSVFNTKRRAGKLSATPLWADDFVISEAYELADMRTKATGVKWHVDHIVPLNSKLVCGLHCEFNLRVITGKENISKGNRYWPDMPSQEALWA